MNSGDFCRSNYGASTSVVTNKEWRPFKAMNLWMTFADIEVTQSYWEDVFDDEDILEAGEKGNKGFEREDKNDLFVNVYVSVWANTIYYVKLILRLSLALVLWIFSSKSSFYHTAIITHSPGWFSRSSPSLDTQTLWDLLQLVNLKSFLERNVISYERGLEGGVFAESNFWWILWLG